MLDDPILDNAAWASLTGPHAHLAERRGSVVRYPVDMSPFAGVAPGTTTFDDVAALFGPGAEAHLPALVARPAWDITFHVPGVQLVDDGVAGAIDAEAVVLGTGDVAEMTALVERTKPGPFLPRTVEMGTYVGIRREGRLVAMAGERLHPPGWTEISAVCTDAGFRGQGLATRLIRHVVAGIRARGERPMLHTGAENVNAIRLYEQLGFRLRRQVDFTSYRVPALTPAP
ncbi:GNAT family N-acetyltransferase [Actinokineospora bangkokensis]|uniref:GNAT family N-acetyltransferase n=1 Tax=Actinokineospora bangkokensis TaxID=1193682 RepID=A0A1Q9LM40_9PSEU|nr:GNAT family N-acetyltransferase [Actinokineospora bangkokensis]